MKRKYCSKCQRTRLAKFFHKNAKQGLAGYCKSCAGQSATEWCRANRKKSRINARNNYGRNGDSIRRRARELNRTKKQQAKNHSWNQAYYKKNKKRILATNRRWYYANHKRAKQLSREGWLKRAYNLSPEQHKRLLVLQGGKCAVCRAKHNHQKKALAVDHCHTTNQVRGLLCGKCNRAVGLLNDCHLRAAALSAYLKSPPAIAALRNP